MNKFQHYTEPMLAYALADCYAALEAGKYEADHPYGRKLWAEIDAIRDVQMSRRNLHLTGSKRVCTPA